MKALVTGGGGFIGSNVVGRSSRAATTCACSTTSRPEAARTSQGSARRPARRGRPALVRARARSRSRGRGRLPPGCAAVGPPLGPGSAHHDGGQHRGHAERPPRGPRRGRPTHRQRVVLLRLRKHRHAPAGRDAGARPDLAVCRCEARGRALLYELQPRVRDGDRLASVLQRLRTAARTRPPSTPPSSRASSAPSPTGSP